MKRVAFVVGWLCCSVLTWGMYMGVSTCEFPQFNSIPECVVFSVGGPFGLSVALVVEVIHCFGDDGTFQFRMRPLSREERWRAFHELYPTLTRYYFDHGHDPDWQECKASDITGCK